MGSPLDALIAAGIPNGSNGQNNALNTLYQQLVGRPADPAASNQYVSRNNAGESMSNIMQEILQSPEYQAKHTGPGAMKNVAPTSFFSPQQRAPIDWSASRQATQGMNAMPYVLDPSKLSGDTAQNLAMMYTKPTTATDAAGGPTAAGSLPSTTDPQTQILALQQQIQELQSALSSMRGGGN
jgi:hypothetical protein